VIGSVCYLRLTVYKLELPYLNGVDVMMSKSNRTHRYFGRFCHHVLGFWCIQSWKKKDHSLRIVVFIQV
jgi:hypothetical protein